MKTLLVIIAVSSLLAAFALPAFAQEPGEIPTFDKALILASGPLVAAIVGVLLSWVVEWVPKYEGFAPKAKRLVFSALCMAVPLLAAALRGALGYVEWSFDPLFWHAIWAGAAAGFAGNLVHTRKL